MNISDVETRRTYPISRVVFDVDVYETSSAGPSSAGYRCTRHLRTQTLESRLVSAKQRLQDLDLKRREHHFAPRVGLRTRAMTA